MHPISVRDIDAKLADLVVSPQVVGCVLSFFENQSFQVGTYTVVFEEVAIPSGVLQGTMIGPPPFLAKVIDLSRGLNLFCQMFADDMKIGGRCEDVLSTQLD